jgi:hypothetical protein
VIWDASDYGDDGYAIQHAIDLATSAGEGRGGSVYVPRVKNMQHWLLHEPLRVTGGCKLYGDGAPGRGQSWGGTIFKTAGEWPAVEVLDGRGFEMESIHVKSDGDGIHLSPSKPEKRTLSRLTFRNVSVESRDVAFLMEGTTDNDQCDTVSLYDCQLWGRVGISSRSKQAVSVHVWGGSVSGHEYGVDHRLGFIHFHGTNFHTQGGCLASIRQMGGQSHLTLDGGCYGECWFGDFLRIEGEHWRPTTMMQTRVIMQRCNTGRFVLALQAHNLRIRSCCTFEQGADQKVDGEWLDNAPLLADGVRSRAARLGPGSKPR